jgi:hypothetical protein
VTEIKSEISRYSITIAQVSGGKDNVSTQLSFLVRLLGLSFECGAPCFTNDIPLLSILIIARSQWAGVLVVAAVSSSCFFCLPLRLLSQSHPFFDLSLKTTDVGVVLALVLRPLFSSRDRCLCHRLSCFDGLWYRSPCSPTNGRPTPIPALQKMAPKADGKVSFTSTNYILMYVGMVLLSSTINATMTMKRKR